jgi:hypothetical protein
MDEAAENSGKQDLQHEWGSAPESQSPEQWPQAPQPPTPAPSPGQIAPAVTDSGWDQRAQAALHRASGLTQRGATAARVAARQVAQSSQNAWNDRERIAQSTGEQAKKAYRTAAHGASAAYSATATGATKTWQTTGTVYTSAGALPTNPDGSPRRPWEVIVSAVLAVIAPLFIVLAMVLTALGEGRFLRWGGQGLTKAGEESGIDALGTAGTIATVLSWVIIGTGIVIGLAVIIAFAVYAWRILVGRGRARWVAVGALVVALYLGLPFSPLLVALFELFGLASVVFAFLPRSTGWFALRKREAMARPPHLERSP